MPRYFFHLRNGPVFEEDAVGIEFPSVEAAIFDAEVAAREMMVDKALAGHTDFSGAFEIADNEGTVVAKVPLAQSEKRADGALDALVTPLA